MAVMSVAYHGADATVLSAFAAGIVALSPDEAKKYYEYGLRMSPEIVRNALEHLMATKYNEPFSKLGLSYYGQGREEGLVAGERGTVLMVLKARGLAVSDAQGAVVADAVAEDADPVQVLAHLRAAISSSSSTRSTEGLACARPSFCSECSCVSQHPRCATVWMSLADLPTRLNPE